MRVDAGTALLVVIGPNITFDTTEASTTYMTTVLLLYSSSFLRISTHFSSDGGIYQSCHFHTVLLENCTFMSFLLLPMAVEERFLHHLEVILHYLLCPKDSLSKKNVLDNFKLNWPQVRHKIAILLMLFGGQSHKKTFCQHKPTTR